MVLLCLPDYDKETKQTRRVGKCGMVSPESSRFSPEAGSELTFGALNQTARMKALQSDNLDDV
jgi:hypothetical protein